MVRVLVALTRVLPRSVAVRAWRFVAEMAHRGLRRDRAVGMSQLARALPGASAAERACMLRRSHVALARNLVDMVRQDAPVDVDAEALAKLQQARDRGPVVVLMAHLGAWELVGPVLVGCLAPFGALTANPHNEWVDRWLRRERRARGITVFDRDLELRPALRWLRQGGHLAVLGDHRTRGSLVLAPWFGKSAPTVAGPSRLARAASATILPVGIRRSGDRHRLEVGDGFAPSGLPEDDARCCNAALEELILRSPEEWTWIHDRYGEFD